MESQTLISGPAPEKPDATERHGPPRGKAASGALRILLVSNFFPPYVKGGAEVACSHLAAWLSGQGHQVAVLTLAPPGQGDSEEDLGFKIYRRRVPNLYHAYDHARVPKWKKPLWHLVDHFNPAIRGVAMEIIRTFKPDVINTHNLPGMGYNLWAALAKCDIPVLVTLHDPAIACIRSAMFKKGRSCEMHCTECSWSMRLKRHYLESIPEVSFASPSRALLAKLQTFLPSGTKRAVYLGNPLDYPRRGVPRERARRIEFLYVGQVTSHKGVDFMLEVFASLEPKADAMHLTVIGNGNILDALKAQYADSPWVTFTGFIPQQEVSGYMNRSDLLMVPSIWVENAPLVVMQAIACAIPVLASDIGGLPEFVTDGETGRLLPPGDKQAWRQALRQVLDDPAVLDSWKRTVAVRNSGFDINTLGEKYVALLRTLTGSYE